MIRWFAENGIAANFLMLAILVAGTYTAVNHVPLEVTPALSWDTVMIEVPNPKHPRGVRGVGEVPLVPSLAAIANAGYDALGNRFDSLPMSPPKVLAALEGMAVREAAE